MTIKVILWSCFFVTVDSNFTMENKHFLFLLIFQFDQCFGYNLSSKCWYFNFLWPIYVPNKKNNNLASNYLICYGQDRHWVSPSKTLNFFQLFFLQSQYFQRYSRGFLKMVYVYLKNQPFLELLWKSQENLNAQLFTALIVVVKFSLNFPNLKGNRILHK